MRVRILTIALLLGAGIAQAQVVSPLGGSTNNPQGPPAIESTSPGSATKAPSHRRAASSTPHARRTLAQRFAAANTSNDGKLTKDQAHAGKMNAVVRDFDAIDKDKRGYVSLDQIKSFQADRRAARKAAKAQAPAKTPQ